MGARIIYGGERAELPGYPVKTVDLTGAGDVFAAAFLLRYGETRDRPTAARFANCVASFAVEGTGTAALPTLEQVEDRLQRGRLRLVPS
jgi:sugar/nucleoside kinase (ribokinase family)